MQRELTAITIHTMPMTTARALPTMTNVVVFAVLGPSLLGDREGKTVTVDMLVKVGTAEDVVDDISTGHDFS